MIHRVQNIDDGWQSALPPFNEEKRIEALTQLSILDTGFDDALDTITKVVAKHFGAPICLISFVDKNRQWFKSSYGFSDARETPREQAFCTFPVQDGKPMIVDNTLEDDRFRHNPLVQNNPDIRFYAGAPLKFQDGLVLGTLCIIDQKPRHDIDDENIKFLEDMAQIVMSLITQKSVQEELNAVRRQASMALEGADLGLWDTNIRTGYTYFNEHWETMLGYSPGELEPRFTTWERLVHPQDYPLTMEIFKRHLEGKSDYYNVEHRMMCKDGTWKWIMCRGRVFEWDDSGVAIRALGVHSDITARKKIEQSLIQEQKRADAANNAKSDFLANMSHEIRTPMNGIIGTASLLQETELNKEQQKYTDIILKSGDTLLNVINDILDFSKIEAGKLNVTFEDFDLYKTVNHVTALYTPLAQKKHLKLQIDIEPDIPQYLISDESRIRQVLNNLLSNAIKFTHHGSVIIEVSRRQEYEQELIHFSVTDTGIGVEKAQQSSLFEKFLQIDRGKGQAEIEGTGLGLAICKSLVELMNGTIGMHSTVGTGSEFWFSLPLIISSKEAIDQVESLISKPIDIHKPLQYRHYDAHVLLAEDVETNQLIICDMLSHFGITMDIAQNGKEALDMALHGHYDLILMDIRMPVLDGLEAARDILSQDKNAPPIVALTAHAMEEHKNECFDSGMKGFVNKPVRPEALATIFEEFLSDKATQTDDKRTDQSHSLIESSFLDGARAKSPDMASKYAHIALKDIESRLPKLIESAAQKNYAAVQEYAHSMKSVAMNVDATDFSGISKKIEKLCESEETQEQVDALVQKMEQMFPKIKSMLERYII